MTFLSFNGAVEVQLHLYVVQERLGLVDNGHLVRGQGVDGEQFDSFRPCGAEPFLPGIDLGAVLVLGALLRLFRGGEGGKVARGRCLVGKEAREGRRGSHGRAKAVG